MKIYLVGGAVRDKLLGLPVKERDWVVVGSTPEEMLAKGFQPVGKNFPVFINPLTGEEYALARTERKKGRGYYGFEWFANPSITLEEDLIRRDLTINAMAETEEGQIIDPYRGQQDLKDKKLRHVSSAFSEDPVRILRVARFACRFAPLGFTIAKETLNLMSHMVKTDEVNYLVAERVWQEIQRSLMESDPTQFFLVLRACGALERIWPNLNKLWGIPQKAEYHPEVDTGVHVMMALAIATKLTKDPIIRFATLCHDLGKGETPTTQWPSHQGHEERGIPLIQDFCKRYRVPNEYRDLAILVSRFHLCCHRAFELKESTLFSILECIDIFRKPFRLEQFLLACESDARGRLGLENNPYPQADRFRQAFQIIKNIDIKPLLEAGFKGALLGEKIYQYRLQKLKESNI